MAQAFGASMDSLSPPGVDHLVLSPPGVEQPVPPVPAVVPLLPPPAVVPLLPPPVPGAITEEYIFLHTKLSTPTGHIYHTPAWSLW